MRDNPAICDRPATETSIIATFQPVPADLATTALALARRSAAGATMWCHAPSWDPHAQHIAVEVGHPVVVGKHSPSRTTFRLG